MQECRVMRYGKMQDATTCEVQFSANVNLRSFSLYVVVRPSVVCNVRAPYSGD